MHVDTVCVAMTAGDRPAWSRIELILALVEEWEITPGEAVDWMERACNDGYLVDQADTRHGD
jgi:hypothetical protein